MLYQLKKMLRYYKSQLSQFKTSLLNKITSKFQSDAEYQFTKFTNKEKLI